MTEDEGIVLSSLVAIAGRGPVGLFLFIDVLLEHSDKVADAGGVIGVTTLAEESTQEQHSLPGSL
ncbi:hypothetical protein ASPSYDRAFT_52643 [Aspergillus sydowii CBS 593.65]|uniref:Uncharacterized protein n=1 Tax=Aspergillus sydowii CBS 593.65 TaxID=1036612 RepID=A0A1L9SY60_9EURO|nr:uncharacterized protein ASPSYDRAFT_52643 [Aspergillus sydowii CBS 593.65]OJJ52011.1 hypothetical protein ASPSYDRAFT_52643 [Aspergillus sydowii CBS 593.65]